MPKELFEHMDVHTTLPLPVPLPVPLTPTPTRSPGRKPKYGVSTYVTKPSKPGKGGCRGDIWEI